MTTFTVRHYGNCNRTPTPHTADRWVIVPFGIDGYEKREPQLPIAMEMAGDCDVFVLIQTHDSTMLFTFEGVGVVTMTAEKWCEEQGGEWEMSEIVVAFEEVNTAMPWSNGRPVMAQKETIAIAVRKKT